MGDAGEPVIETSREWVIRRGTRADLPTVLALWRGAEASPSATDTESALDRLIEHDPQSLFLAESNGEVIGSLIVAWDGWRGSFYRLAVHPNWRRKGVATALVRAGEDRLRRLGAHRLTAIVSADSESIDFWKAAGYEHSADQARFVRAASGMR